MRGQERPGEARPGTWKVFVLSAALSSQPLVSTQTGPASSVNLVKQRQREMTGLDSNNVNSHQAQ